MAAISSATLSLQSPSGDAVNGKASQPCSALADVINRPSPFGEGGPYSFLPSDLSPLLVLLMSRLADNAADDDNIIWDFSESFGLNRRAVMAAVKAYRHASATVH